MGSSMQTTFRMNKTKEWSANRPWWTQEPANRWNYKWILNISQSDVVRIVSVWRRTPIVERVEAKPWPAKQAKFDECEKRTILWMIYFYRWIIRAIQSRLFHRSRSRTASGCEIHLSVMAKSTSFPTSLPEWMQIHPVPAQFLGRHFHIFIVFHELPHQRQQSAQSHHLFPIRRFA